ncbi:MAG: tyrosine-type recombinase/integrase [Candidatus Hodarchaeota archaeon]
MRNNNQVRDNYFKKLEQECLVGLSKISTFKQRRKAVNYFINFLNNSKIDLRHLDPTHLQDFLQFLSQKKTYKGTNLAPSTIKQIYALAKSFYVRCYERHIASQHPDLIFTKNMLQRYKIGERKLPKYIDQDRMRKLLDNCPDRWKALLHFMYDTGARISEVLNVRREHLDFNKALVQIYEPKTMNVRVTSLSDKTIYLLQDYFENHRGKARAGHEPFVFVNQQRRKMSPRAIQYVVKKISTDLLGHQYAITPHFFRAACAVHLLESGVDIRQVQEIIGWKSLAVVQNYTRITPQRQAMLKKQHHPGFRSEEPNQPRDTVNPASINPVKFFQQQLIDERKRHQQDIKELKAAFREEMSELRYQQSHQQELDELRRLLQEEQSKRAQERQEHEQRIKELLVSQKQLIQLLSQKSS